MTLDRAASEHDTSGDGRASGEGGLLRRDREKAGFPELFFDLVFVFALIQMSHTFAEDFGMTSIVEAAILLLALWWVWIQTTLLTNLLDTRKAEVRLLLFALMFCGILLSIALPEAFHDKGLLFASVYAAMQIGRSLFSLFAHRNADRPAFLTFLRMTIWLTFSAGLWLSGALVEPSSRIALWSVAILIEYAAPTFNYYLPGLMRGANGETLRVSGEHFAERTALFVIICLGETILTTGKTAVEHMQTPLTFLVFCSAFASTVLMWWLYFHDGQKRMARKAENTRNPQLIAEVLFVYGHLPIVMGIVMTAVGEDFSLSQAFDPAGLRETVTIAGGPALFLTGTGGLKFLAGRGLPSSHCAGAIAIVGLGIVSSLPPFALQFSATAILLIVAVWEFLSLRTGVADRIPLEAKPLSGASEPHP